MGLHLPGEYERHKALDVLLRDGEQSGRALREKIDEDLCTATPTRQRLTRCKMSWLLTLSRAGFYQMMADLEDENAVECWTKDKQIEGIKIGERWYRIKEGGIRVLEAEEVRDMLPDFRMGFA